MAAVTNELIYEVLKSMQERMGRMESVLIELKAEIGAVRTHLSAVEQDVGNIYAILGRHETRLDRIERRLELREPELT